MARRVAVTPGSVSLDIAEIAQGSFEFSQPPDFAAFRDTCPNDRFRTSLVSSEQC